MIKIDNKLETLKQRVLRMVNLINKMYENVYISIENDDSEKALEVIKMDEFVNRYEEEVNDLAIESLALLSPVACDLRKVISAIKITSDLERIGDYAKNIASFVIKKGHLEDSHKQQVKTLIDSFLTMLDHAIDAYDQENDDWAMQIPVEDQEINDGCKELIKSLKNDNNSNIDEILNISTMIRNIERAGDHTKNICEHVIYQVKGQHIEFD